MPPITSPKDLQTIALRLFGTVNAPDFPGWINRHAIKLGLQDVQTSLRTDHLRAQATGQDEMLNAWALACSLGPQSALVDRIVVEKINTNPQLEIEVG